MSQSSGRRRPRLVRAALLGLSLIGALALIACDSAPAPPPATPGTAGAPTADVGTVRSVPTPGILATATGGALAPSATTATLPPTPAGGAPSGAGGTPSGPGTPPPAPTIAEAEAVIVYSLIAHDLVTQSQAAAGTQDVPAYIGIDPHAGRGTFLDTSASTITIPDDLIDNMADLNTSVSFAEFIDAVGPPDEGGQVQDAGIYLTLGELQPQGDANHVMVYASFYRATDDATGYRYLMEHADDGAWVIKDRQTVWDH